MNQKVEEASNSLMDDYQHFEKQIEVSPQWVYKKPYDFKIYPKFSNPYWYHPDHLGSSSYITDTRGIITQHMEYLPFGATLVEEHLNSNNSPYKFNAKQLDEETGWYYYGARYYNPKWSFFISVDPLAEVMPSWSPYTYTFNNPVRYTDPTGMVPVDDYFNKDGKYLGSDNAVTDMVRIIDQSTWDDNKTINNEGEESIDHTIGNGNSVAFSESNLSTEQELEVYQHYNPTDLSLKANTAAENGGAAFVAEKYSDGSTKEHFKINTEGNKKGVKVADDANAIKNVFVHEKDHYDNYKNDGFDKYAATPKNHREKRAVVTQMKHSTFSKTSKSFQRGVISYGVRHGLQTPVSTLKPFGIKQ